MGVSEKRQHFHFGVEYPFKDWSNGCWKYSFSITGINDLKTYLKKAIKEMAIPVLSVKLASLLMLSSLMVML